MWHIPHRLLVISCESKAVLFSTRCHINWQW